VNNQYVCVFVQESEVMVAADEPSMSACYAFIGQLLVSHLGPLLATPYIIEANFLPFLRGLCESDAAGPGAPSQQYSKPRASSSKATYSTYKRQKLMLFMDLLWDYMEVRLSFFVRWFQRGRRKLD